MPAPTESRLKSDIACLGVIAGAGDVPAKLLKSCDRVGQDVFVVGFQGQTDPNLLSGRRHMLTHLGAAGHIIKTLQNHNVRDLVMIGAIRRPGLADIRPDFRAMQILLKIGFKALGDDALLRLLRTELEREGFRVHGVQRFVENLVGGAGALGKFMPVKGDWPGIRRGAAAARALGALDIGQSVIVQDGVVLAVEGAEGTDELIRRCVALRRKSGAVYLVKMCKPQQDHDFDLPTIGPETLRICNENDVGGIIYQAGHTILVERDEMQSYADHNRLIVFGFDPENPDNE